MQPRVLSMQPGVLLAILVGKAHHWFMYSMWPAAFQSSQGLSCRAALLWVHPQPVSGCSRLFIPRCRTWQLSPLNFTRFLVCPFLQPLSLPYDNSPAFEHEASINDIHCSLPIHRSCHFIITGRQVIFGKSTLAAFDHLLLHVPRPVLQQDSLHDLPGIKMRLTGLLLHGLSALSWRPAFACFQISGTFPTSTTSENETSA